MFTRRQALRSTLFGASYLGLRTLATGLPAALLLDPRKALAEVPAACDTKAKAQFVIFATSGGGDALNANVPGTYEDPGIHHSSDPGMAPGKLSLAGAS